MRDRQDAAFDRTPYGADGRGLTPWFVAAGFPYGTGGLSVRNTVVSGKPTSRPVCLGRLGAREASGMARAFMARTTLIAALLCAAIPLSGLAMTPMNDEDLDLVSGQSGVSIFVDVTISIHIDAIAWGDEDGIGGAQRTRSAGDRPFNDRSTSFSISVCPNLPSPLLMEVMKRYSSSHGVCFFPDTGAISIENGVFQRR